MAGPATGTTLSAVDPRRILDTRDRAAWVAAGAIVRLEFGSARSVALNVTAVRPLGPGFVTVWPCSQPAPVVSQMSWSLPRTVATAVLAAADQGGSVCLRPSVGTHLLIDLLATDAAVGAVQTSVSARTNEWLLGHSVRGRPIMARAFGNPEGVPIVGVGVIHGNEESGVPIVAQLKPMSPPSNVAMWLVDSVNPDGQAAQTRGNVNGVDLNRNFPTNWQPIARTNNYSGTAAGSEPETRAMLAFLDIVRPHLGVWWHTVGDYADDSRSAMEQPELLEIYVARANIGIDDAPCLGFCGGTATQHANRSIVGGSHFVVELPSPITTAAVGRHAAAFMASAAATR